MLKASISGNENADLAIDESKSIEQQLRERILALNEQARRDNEELVKWRTVHGDGSR
jgi:hypothetical protein